MGKATSEGYFDTFFSNLHGNMSEAGNHFLWYLPRLAPIPDLQISFGVARLHWPTAR
jgi:hypothetical protein